MVSVCVGLTIWVYNLGVNIQGSVCIVQLQMSSIYIFIFILYNLVLAIKMTDFGLPGL